MYQTIIYEENSNNYVKVTLNRPEKRNAVSKQMIKELKEVIQKIKDAEHIKFLVLTGAEQKAFCSGGDLKEFHGNMNEQEAFDMLNSMKEVLYEIAILPIPTICLLNGDARGGGCELATACDIRIAKENTRHGFIQGRLGITPGWGGGAILYHRIHPTDAFRWLTHADVYQLDYLLSIGWLQSVISTKDFHNPQEWLTPYIQKSREQLMAFKKQLLTHINVNLLNEMNEEVIACSKLWDSPSHHQAVSKFLNKK